MVRDDRSWGPLGEFIRSQRTIANLSLRQLAKLARVSNPYLSQIERGVYKPSADVLKAIADALQLSAESLFARAGLLDQERPASGGVEEAVRLDPRLNAEQKTTLLRVYRSFLAES